MRRALILLFVGSAGCGTPADDAPPVHPVTGFVLVGGMPADGAHVAFRPIGGGTTCAVAVTGPDGRFRLSTRMAGDGAPAGDYVVTVLWFKPGVDLCPCESPDPTVHDRLHGAYADGTKSDLRATVRPGGNEITLRAEVSALGWNLPRIQPSGRPPERDARGDRR